MKNDISIKKAATINFASKYISIFLQLVYMAILARILSPEDFGIVAIITVFTTFFALFSDMGFGAAIIHDKSLQTDELENIFSFTFYLAIILALAFVAFSIPLSIIYNNSVYRLLGVILSFSLFFNTLNTVPNANLLKNLRFSLIGVRLVVITGFSGVITIVLAYVGFKYYALAINSVFVAFSTFFWNYISSPVKFKFRFNKKSIVKIKSYSSYLFAFNIINYFARNMDNLLIGKFWGDIELGYYNKAYQLMLYPVQNLTGVITPVLQPILTEHKDNKEYLYSRFLMVVKILSLLGIIVSIYSYFAADEIILIVYGPQWEESISCFKYLSLSIWAQMINSISGSMFQTLGKTKLQFCRGILVVLITLTAILIGMLLGNIQSVAFFVAIAYNLHFLSMLYFLIYIGFKESVFEFLKRLFPDLIIVLIMIIGISISKRFVFENLIYSALYKAIVCTVTYILGLIITKQHHVLLNLLIKK